MKARSFPHSTDQDVLLRAIKEEPARDRQAEALAGNPELIRQQMDQHAEIVSEQRASFGRKISDLEQTIHNLKNKLCAVGLDRDINRKKLHELQHLLENSVAMIVPNGRGIELVTFWTAIEQNWFRPLCLNCKTVECFVEEGETTGCDAEVTS